MIDFEEIEGTVRARLADEGNFRITSMIEGGQLILNIRRQEASGVRHGERQNVSIQTSGVESFFVKLDRLYEIREFAYELADQRQLLRVLADLARLYLQGEGAPEVHKRFLRMPLKCLRFYLDDETYLAEEI